MLALSDIRWNEIDGWEDELPQHEHPEHERPERTVKRGYSLPARLYPVDARPPSRPSHRPSAATFHRRRIAAAVVLTVVVLAAWAAVRMLGGASAFSSPEHPPSVRMTPIAARTHVVQPGETFWSIAESLAPGADLRPIVDQLVASHRGAQLTPGELITLPG